MAGRLPLRNKGMEETLSSIRDDLASAKKPFVLGFYIILHKFKILSLDFMTSPVFRSPRMVGGARTLAL